MTDRSNGTRPGLDARAAFVSFGLACAGAIALAQEAPASRPAPILEIALDVARADHRSIDADWVRAEIARIADRARARLGESTAPDARVAALVGALFDDARLESVTTLDSPETLHVDSVLRGRKGYCLSLSVVALAVGERLGIPLFGVAAPNHFFVRYDDGSARINVELTRRGAPVSDDEFRARMGDAWRKDSIYLRNLTPREVRAVLLHNRGFVALSRGRADDARRDLTEAIRELPDLPEAHRNLGVLYGEAKRWDDARRCFDRALALYPADVDALINRALCRRAQHDDAGAAADLDVALLLEPDRRRALELRAEIASSRPASGAVRPLDSPPPGVQPGLRARYYRGMSFEQLAHERVDADLAFDWGNASPAPGVPRDEFSVRWDGWLKLPRDGTYSLFVVANDGGRLTLDDKVALENWREMGRENWYGSADLPLSAGWHRIVVEHFDAIGGARLIVKIGVSGQEKPLKLSDHFFHEASPAR